MDKHIEMKSAKSKPRSQTWYMLTVSFCLFVFNRGKFIPQKFNTMCQFGNKFKFKQIFRKT